MIGQEAHDQPDSAKPQGDAMHTDPKSLAVQTLSGLKNAVFPVIAVYFATSSTGSLAIIAAICTGALLIGIGAFSTYLRWRKFTYSVNAEDIRVESGILSRTARSVPFERIQDVSLEQSLVLRLFGLVAVKFETGSGGGDDIALLYLSEAEGERLRELVRDRKDGASNANEVRASEVVGGDISAQMVPAGEESSVLFAMDNRRLFTFGLFEFSLAVFAVLAGLTQYVEWFVDFEIWDADLWRGLAEEQQGWLGGLSQVGQIVGALLGLIALFVVGSATGLARTYLRDWDFKLEETPRGFRRRRGLLTKTDVVMPAHRVQAIKIGTGLLRNRFGWRSLNFVSLAQDSGSANHTVAPFAQDAELAPVIEAAGFRPPDETLDWHRASKLYRTDSIILGSAIFVIAAIPVALFAPAGMVFIPIALAAIMAFANYYAWRFHRHAIDHTQIFASRGLFAPRTQIASRIKLHSVGLSQGPIAQRRGYATVRLGLAGGIFLIPGVPIERARQLRQQVIESIASTDFSQINH